MAWRILIKGTSGAGKSTLGRVLARHLNVPFIELDALHHGPNWVPASAEALRQSVLGSLDDERGWVVDGNYDSKLGSLVVARARIVIWLDLPLHTKLWRLVTRTSRRWWNDEQLWNGNRETLKSAVWGRDALLLWMLRSHYRHRRAWPGQLRSRGLVRLKTNAKVLAWVADFRANAPSAAPR